MESTTRKSTVPSLAPDMVVYGNYQQDTGFKYNTYQDSASVGSLSVKSDEFPWISAEGIDGAYPLLSAFNWTNREAQILAYNFEGHQASIHIDSNGDAYFLGTGVSAMYVKQADLGAVLYLGSSGEITRHDGITLQYGSKRIDTISYEDDIELTGFENQIAVTDSLQFDLPVPVNGWELWIVCDMAAGSIEFDPVNGGTVNGSAGVVSIVVADGDQLRLTVVNNNFKVAKLAA